MADRSQRTEKPTGRRLQKARDEGSVPRTRELSGALTLLGVVAWGHVAGGRWLARLAGDVSGSLAHLARPELDATAAIAVLAGVGATTAVLLAGPLGVVLVAGVAGNLLQGPPPLTLEPLKFKLSRLDPIAGLRKLFALRSWVEMLKAVIKLALFTAIAVSAVRQGLREGLLGAPGAAGTVAALTALGAKVLLRVGLLALFLALLDWLFARYDHVRSLKMSKQEVKDERRELEGDPLVKSRVRSKQLTLARSRMMADVPKASVVVTNPTHYAVALRYVPGETAVPQLVAKGRALVAARIRAVALEHRIPVVSDPPLARALYRAVPVGGVIPPRLFRAVAEVLALVLRRRHPRRGGVRPPEVER